MNNNIKNQIQKIINFYKIENHEKAIELALQFLKTTPESDIVLNLLGLSYQKINRLDKSETSFKIANQINPNNISVLNNLGNNFKYRFNFDKAREFFLLALKKKPDYTEALLNLGNLEFAVNKNEKAIELFEKALKTNSKAIPVNLNLAIGYQSMGNFKKAIDHLTKINELNEKFTRADKMLSVLFDYKVEKKHYEKMINKMKLNLNNEQKIYLFFALGKANEDKSNYTEALEFFKKGNKLKRINSNYSIDKDIQLFSNIKLMFENFNFNLISKNYKKKPIFIVGMPRSGTTLIEQIISSHKCVKSLGEINFFNISAEQEFKKILNKTVSLDNFDMEHLRKTYENYLNNFEINKEFFTDKTLLNFFWIGFIKICYPKAKVIICLRDPKDNCFSIYKNLFDYEGAWCYDEKELSSYYRLFKNIIEFWKQKIPNELYEIKYEDLIERPEKNIRELIKYCELDWDESCLNFHKNKSAIKTLSVNQARKQIYKTSINSFKKYKETSDVLFKDL